MEHAIAIIIVVALCTALTRFLPFWIFAGKKELPETIKYLGKVLPSAVMTILVVYCLKGVNPMKGSRGIPELLAITVVAALHLWKKNTLLSIGVGTVCYMFFVQVVF